VTTVSAGQDIRADLRLIADMITPGARVLDVGCGDGHLLGFLARGKRVDGRGLELSMDGVHAAVSHGLSVIQGDADTDLDDYPSGAFDYAILSQTLQATRNPQRVLANLVRIGRHAIVSIPNFGYWRVRLQLLLTGRMPRTRHLSHAWWDTPNIHLCTLSDFEDLCASLSIAIDRRTIIGRAGRPRSTPFLPNLTGEQAVYLLHKG